MKTLVTADLHASANPRDAYRWVFLEETLPALIKEHNVGRLLLLGDFTEVKDNHPAPLVNRLVDAVAKLTEVVRIYALKGNHDYVAEDVPFYRFLRHLPRVRWINEPTDFEMLGLGSCVFLPHSRNPAEEWRPWLADDRDWYFCHQTFRGADLSQGRKAEGWSAPFSVGARAVSGDVHSPQKLGAVTYVGAPYLVDFGDDYAPRVLLLNGHKMRSVPVPGPQKVLVEVPRRSGPCKRAPSAGDVVKVRVELPAGAKQSRAELRAEWRAWAERKNVYLYAVEIITPKAAPAKPARDRHRASDVDLVRAYAKKMRQGKASVAAGLKITEEVS